MDFWLDTESLQVDPTAVYVIHLFLLRQKGGAHVALDGVGLGAAHVDVNAGDQILHHLAGGQRALKEPVAKRHQMVSGSLALPYCFFIVSFLVISMEAGQRPR